MLISKKWSFFIVALLATWLGAIAARAQAPWHIPGAGVRFETQIASRPTIPDAGIVAILPDAGILPKGKLKADVVDESGKPLKANLLWHNPNEGLALVFEDTPAERALIYVSSAPDYPKASAPLRPSLLLFVRNGGKPGLEQAHALAAKTPFGPDVYFTLVERIFHSYSPVGRDDQTSSYYSGWFNAGNAGKTYFYTVSKDGSEFFIDGKPVYSWLGLHGRAGGERAEKGAWIDLSAGIHRIEYYHFAQTFGGRECQLGWQQAGESQPRSPKNPNLPNLSVTGPMTESDFVRSGAAKLKTVSSRQGPLAVFSCRWEAILQPGQNPVCLFTFAAFGAENMTTNTAFEWDFGGNRKIKGPQAAWLYGGMGDQRVSLTVSSGAGKSTCSRSFFPKSLDPARNPPRLSINRAEDRRKARDVFLAMCRATPADRRPGESWNQTLWEGLAAVVDAQTEYDLLNELFQRSRQDILDLDDKTRWLMEDAFFTALCQVDAKSAAQWLDRFEKEEKTAARIGQWKARRVHFYIFEAGNPDQARLAANAFAGAAGGLNQTELAMIRLGDVELFNGNPDQARRFYAQAQELGGRKTDAVTPMAPAKSEQAKPDAKSGATDKKPGRMPDATKKSGIQPNGRDTQPVFARAAPGAPPAVEPWKAAAVREASFYSTARNLIGQQAYGEARRTLDQWELELPLNKLAGDYPLAEAEYYMALKQFNRAQKILAVYRQSVDMSNTLPQAMKMELYCLARLNRDKDARELGSQIVKRLPNHPLADEVRTALDSAEKTGKMEIDLDAWSQDWTASEKVDAAGLSQLFGIKEISTKPRQTRPRKNNGARPAPENKSK